MYLVKKIGDTIDASHFKNTTIQGNLDTFLFVVADGFLTGTIGWISAWDECNHGSGGGNMHVNSLGEFLIRLESYFDVKVGLKKLTLTAYSNVKDDPKQENSDGSGRRCLGRIKFRQTKPPGPALDSLEYAVENALGLMSAFKSPNVPQLNKKLEFHINVEEKDWDEIIKNSKKPFILFYELRKKKSNGAFKAPNGFPTLVVKHLDIEYNKLKELPKDTPSLLCFTVGVVPHCGYEPILMHYGREGGNYKTGYEWQVKSSDIPSYFKNIIEEDSPVKTFVKKMVSKLY